VIGVGYGIAMRLVFGHTWAGAGIGFGVMTVAFLFVVPFVIGGLYALRFPKQFELGLARAIFGAMGTSLIAVAATLALAIEGAICVAMAAPVFAVMAGLGGLAGWGMRRWSSRPSRPTLMSAVALTPLVFAPVEHQWRPPERTEQNDTAIHIRASPEAVWREIKSVRAIQPQELPWTLSHAIGLPRPVEATLSSEGNGGVRLATFERGLVFRESVTAWEVPRRLSFSIRAEDVPAGALDEHVAVGGEYFDVLEGTYVLEVLGARDVLLHLSSRHRLSTRFNAYAGLWARFVMSDLQNAILKVIATRAERGL
jgi:hypothetical protein